MTGRPAERKLARAGAAPDGELCEPRAAAARRGGGRDLLAARALRVADDALGGGAAHDEALAAVVVAFVALVRHELAEFVVPAVLLHEVGRGVEREHAQRGRACSGGRLRRRRARRAGRAARWDAPVAASGFA
jgi:hypothetical protein